MVRSGVRDPRCAGALTLTLRSTEPWGEEGLLDAVEERVLASEFRAVFRPRSFRDLGEPSDHSVQWCRAAVRFVIEEALWAPELDWVAGETVELRFRNPANLRCMAEIAERAGCRAPR